MHVCMYRMYVCMYVCMYMKARRYLAAWAKQQVACSVSGLGHPAQAPDPGVLRVQSLHIGSAVVDRTHALRQRGHIVWCTRCGAWAAARARKLKAPCRGSGSRPPAASLALRRLSQGLPPPGLSGWPINTYVRRIVFVD